MDPYASGAHGVGLPMVWLVYPGRLATATLDFDLGLWVFWHQTVKLAYFHTRGKRRA